MGCPLAREKFHSQLLKDDLLISIKIWGLHVTATLISNNDTDSKLYYTNNKKGLKVSIYQ